VPSARGYRASGISPLRFFKGNTSTENVILSGCLCSPRSAWRLKKPSYGLCSAPNSWYDRVREVATAAGLDCGVSDEAVFRLCGGGTPDLVDAMRLIGSALKIGAEESAEDSPFCMRVFVSLLARYRMVSLREIRHYSARE
jgi:hypothetical protein